MTSPSPLATAAPARCTLKPKVGDLPRRISVNGVVIPRDAIARETQNHPAAKPVEAWLAAARALIIRELLLQEARRLSVAPAPLVDEEGRRETGEEAAIRSLIEREVPVPAVDHDTCRRYYEANRARFRSADLFAVRHILIAAPPDDLPARDRARALATEIIATLGRDPQAFADLARAHSACPSGRLGGSLGQVCAGDTVPEFEVALERLAEGTVSSAPVESRYGFHIVALDRRIAGAEVPFEPVAPRIAAWLEEGVRRRAIRRYIGCLAGRAAIEGLVLDSAARPAVQ
jgi:peptidyl-prolyl cis-trans isomerase C